MKKLGLLFTLFLLVACGGGGDNSSPDRDGKGNIDTVDYLPSKSMIKYFSYGWNFPINVGFGGRIELNVVNNKIYITLYVHGQGHVSRIEEIVQNKSIIYDDLNIEGFYRDSSGEFHADNNITYRHVDDGEVLFETIENKTTEYKYYDNGSDIVIGTEHTETSKKCIYQGISNKVYDSYGEILKEGGEFLVLECNKLIKTTYSIDSEYRELEDIDGKTNYYESKGLKYYEKNIGFIAEYVVSKETIKPCIRECQYQDKVDFKYKTNSIVYE